MVIVQPVSETIAVVNEAAVTKDVPKKPPHLMGRMLSRSATFSVVDKSSQSQHAKAEYGKKLAKTVEFLAEQAAAIAAGMKLSVYHSSLLLYLKITAIHPFLFLYSRKGNNSSSLSYCSHDNLSGLLRQEPAITSLINLLVLQNSSQRSLLLAFIDLRFHMHQRKQGMLLRRVRPRSRTAHWYVCSRMMLPIILLMVSFEYFGKRCLIILETSSLWWIPGCVV